MAAAAAVAAAGTLAGLALWARRWPMINDVTTTPEDPPAFRVLEPARGYPPGNAEVQRRAYPDLAPVPLALPPGEAYAAAREAALSLGWRLRAEDAEAGRLEAVAVTRLLRFKDDIVLEVRPQGEGSAVHARSRSRLGRGDLGENARRLRRLAAVLAPSSPGAGRIESPPPKR